MASTQRAGRYGTGKRLFSSGQSPEWLWGPPGFWYQGLALGVKWFGRQVDQSPLSRVEVKNDRSYTFAPVICLSDTASLTFTVTFRRFAK